MAGSSSRVTTQSARSPVRTTLVVIGLVLATLCALLLVYAARRVLTWIVIAAFFAVALHPAASWMERRLTWCKRWLSTLVVFVLVFLVLAGLVALFVVPLVKEGGRFAAQLPQLIRDTQGGGAPR